MLGRRPQACGRRFYQRRVSSRFEAPCGGHGDVHRRRTDWARRRDDWSARHRGRPLLPRSRAVDGDTGAPAPRTAYSTAKPGADGTLRSTLRFVHVDMPRLRSESVTTTRRVLAVAARGCSNWRSSASRTPHARRAAAARRPRPRKGDRASASCARSPVHARRSGWPRASSTGGSSPVLRSASTPRRPRARPPPRARVYVLDGKRRREPPRAIISRGDGGFRPPPLLERAPQERERRRGGAHFPVERNTSESSRACSR